MSLRELPLLNSTQIAVHPRPQIAQIPQIPQIAQIPQIGSLRSLRSLHIPALPAQPCTRAPARATGASPLGLGSPYI